VEENESSVSVEEMGDKSEEGIWLLRNAAARLQRQEYVALLKRL
jgi:hypothetical protein